jgi:hypothetical protein
MQRISRTLLPGTLCFVLAACDDGVLEPSPTDAPLSGPAFAGAPEMETAQFSWTDSYDCGAFDDVQAGSAQLKFWTFYDQAGTPTSERVHYVFKVTHTNSVTGNVLRDDGEGMAFFDLLTGSVTSVGTRYHTTDQGRGLILGGAGRLTTDQTGNVTFIAGLQQDQQPYDWCDLLD